MLILFLLGTKFVAIHTLFEGVKFGLAFNNMDGNMDIVSIWIITWIIIWIIIWISFQYEHRHRDCQFWLPKPFLLRLQMMKMSF